MTKCDAKEIKLCQIKYDRGIDRDYICKQSTSGKIKQIYIFDYMIKKNGAACKVIFQVGVFQGNNFNLTTAYVMTLKKKDSWK